MLDWQFFALSAALLSASERIIHRWNIKKYKESIGYSSMFQMTCAVLAMPAAIWILWDQVYSISIQNLWLVGAAAICWTTFSLLTFKADEYLDASSKSSISRFRVLWSLIIGVVIFDENVTLLKVTGALMVAIAPISLIAFDRKISPKGAFLEIGATISLSLALVFDKLAPQFFDVAVVTFLAFANSAIITMILRSGLRKKNPWAKDHKRIMMVILASLFSLSCYYSLMIALKYGDISVAVPIYMTSPIITTLMAFFLLSERENIVGRITVAFTATVGCILIVL